MRTLVPAALALCLALPAAAASDAPALWSQHCAFCHGEDAKARTGPGRANKIPDLTRPRWQARHGDARIRAIVRDGIRGTKMKAFKDKLSAEEIDALVAHLRALAKADPAAR